MLFYHTSYYLLSLIFYAVLLLGSALLFRTSNLAAAVITAFILVFLGIPTLTVVLMRFSLFPWYVDPIGAALPPLTLYCILFYSQLRESGDLLAAFHLTASELMDDGGTSWRLLLAAFVFGLLVSLSFARKKRQSISYRLLEKWLKTTPEGDKE